jgi:hypothetical protein
MERFCQDSPAFSPIVMIKMIKIKDMITLTESPSAGAVLRPDDNYIITMPMIMQFFLRVDTRI